MISELFQKLRDDTDFFLTSNTGKDFEDRVAQALSNLGLLVMLPEKDFSPDRFSAIKRHVSQKDKDSFIDVEEKEKRHFVKQPFGSQNYPDFLIFSNKKVIPLEIKYSKQNQGKPMWNSNLPRPNGFYIFGAYKRKDITFFCGDDVLEQERRQKMIAFFNQTKNMQENFNKELGSSNDDFSRGFYVYVRRAFEQHAKGEASIDYFNHPDRKVVENKAIERIKDLQ